MHLDGELRDFIGWEVESLGSKVSDTRCTWIVSTEESLAFRWRGNSPENVLSSWCWGISSSMEESLVTVVDGVGSLGVNTSWEASKMNVGTSVETTWGTIAPGAFNTNTTVISGSWGLNSASKIITGGKSGLLFLVGGSGCERIREREVGKMEISIVNNSSLNSECKSDCRTIDVKYGKKTHHHQC